MKKKLKCFLGIFLSLALVLSLMPCMSLTVYADTTKAYAYYDVTTDDNKDKSVEGLAALQVTFNGKKWYIIEDNSTAVNAGTVTLLAADDSFGTSAFKSNDSSNSYNNSTVKGYLDSIVAGTAEEGKPNFKAVANAIKPVTLTTYNYNSMTDVFETTENAKLYLLSVDEAEKVPQNVRKFTAGWWLRSPGQVAGRARYVDLNGTIGSEIGYSVGFPAGLVRPALKLDLSAVTFSSNTFTVKPYAAYDVTTDANKNKSGADLAALQVTFNGKPWYIIEDNSTAVNAGTVTLLAADTSFGKSAFDSTTPYSNRYNSSTIKGFLEGIVAGTAGYGKPDFSGVANAIKPVTLTTYEYNSTTNVYETTENAKLYLLSVAEAEKVPLNVRKVNDDWWLRSPVSYFSSADFVNTYGSVDGNGDGVYNYNTVRPALKLNLSVVHFSSNEFTLNPYASLVNTTTVVKFDNKDWYLIEDNSTAIDDGTVTLLSKECVGASQFNPQNGNNTYSGSNVETAVNNYYTNSISADAKEAVSGSEMFLLSTAQANAIKNTNVLKCPKAEGAGAQYWWLRSPGSNDYHGSSSAAIVDGEYGIVRDSGSPVFGRGGVRPAIKLDLSQVTFTSVNLSDVENANLSEGSGSTRQNYFDVGSRSAMTPVVYTAADGYYFPTDYSVTAVNNISVTRNDYTKITVSGIPNANVTNITLTAPTVKTTPTSVPTAAAVDCTTLDNNDGKLTGVTTAMEYKKSDDSGYTAITGIEVTGLVPGTYYVRYKATDTAYASGNQELTIAGYYEVTYKVVNGTWADGGAEDKTETVQSGSKPASVPTGMKPGSGFTGGAWNKDPANTTITGATTFTYTFTKKPSPSPVTPSAVVKTAPVANTLTYSEQPQELVTAGESTVGEMLYALGNSKSSMPTSGWSTSIPTATDAGTYFVWYKAKGDSYHRDSSPKCVTVTIGRVPSTVTTVPTVKTLLYSGKSQALVTAGEVAGGELQYAIGTDPTTAPKTGWSTEIPKVTDAGTYYIWYKVVGDNDHEDSEPSYAGAATIIENHSDNELAIDEEKGIATVKDDVSGGTTEVPLYVITEGLTYRMYDPNRGEHFYTKNPEEVESLVQLGWRHESDSDFTVVSATEEDAVPVYRLYNPNCGGMHFYTTDAEEAKYLKSIGWNYEGISHYVYKATSTKGTPQHRLYNPNSPSAEHLWTSDEAEVDMLIAVGWIYEGISWRIV